MEEEPKITPCCKPLRLLEMFLLTGCFSLLFLTETRSQQKAPVLSDSVLIFLFVTFGSFLLLVVADVFVQMVNQPMPNVPMILVCFGGFLFCFTSTILLVIAWHQHSNEDSFRTLNVAGLLGGASFLTSCVFLMDSLIVIKFRQ